MKMDKEELKFILQEREGLKIEFKESFDKSIAKEIVAFANADGGRIFLGVTDDGKIKGIKITNKLKSQIHDLARNCDPQIKIDLEEFENILTINVYEGEDKPYKCKDGFFLRIGPNSQKLKRDEIIEFSISEGKIRFDEQIKNNFNFPADFDENKLNKYLELAKITKNISKEQILINLGVAVKENEKTKLNNAGVLFFAKVPEKFFLMSKVICVNYQTNEKVNILDKKIFDNGIIENIQEAVNYVQKHINVEYEIKKLERKEIPQYPQEAIRECIVNAIMHRDYFDKSGDILVEVFKNKIMVSNPGGLVKWMKPEEFGTTSRTRNSLVANLLAKTSYVEKLGTGINRIKKAMSNAKLPEPEFKFNGSFFATLYDKTYLGERVGVKVGERVGVKVGERLTINQIKILKEIDKDRFISAETLSEKVGISKRKIEENISKLKKMGLLKRIGPAKGGHWKVLK
jgi:ATP-dependent DNA helicase RecG